MWEIPIPTLVIQCVESLVTRGGRYLVNDNEPIFVDRFVNENDFAVTLHDDGMRTIMTKMTMAT